jgi:hypothetical protein
LASLLGIVIALAGIAIVAMAGRAKERDGSTILIGVGNYLSLRAD